jgi:hypothetical protein
MFGKRLFFLVAVLLVGCASKEAQLVGTWKARPVKQVSSPNLRDVASASMMSLFTSGMTVEFNKEGKFKMSQMLGWVDGTYTIKGDEVELKFNTFAPQQPVKLVFAEGGKALALKTEFESDARVFFDKQP